MSENRTRFEVDINASPGKERLIITCNFPDLESGAIHKKRAFYGERAVNKISRIGNILKKTSRNDNNDADIIDKFIIEECKVGSSSVTTDMMNDKLIAMSRAISDQAMKQNQSAIDNLLSGLGSMDMTGVKIS